MPLDQPAVRRQRVRLAGGSPEPAVPVEQPPEARSRPTRWSDFGRCCRSATRLEPPRTAQRPAELTARDLAEHYTSGLAFFHERFVPHLKECARRAKRRRLGPYRLRRLRRGFGRRFHDASGRGGRRARPRLPVPRRLVWLPSRSDSDGEPRLGRFGPRGAGMPVRAVGAKWTPDPGNARLPARRSALPAEPESLSDHAGRRAARSCGGASPLLERAVLSISFSRGFGLTASQLGVFLLHRDHPYRMRFETQWAWFTYFFNALGGPCVHVARPARAGGARRTAADLGARMDRESRIAVDRDR